MARRRIVTWNIQHGARSSDRRRRVIDTLQAFEADVLVVTEFQISNAGTAIIGALTAAGYETSHPTAEGNKNTVLIASRAPIVASAELSSALPENRHLWNVMLDGISVVGVYIPGGAKKRPYWDAVVSFAASDLAPSLFIGDFNTGTNAQDRDPAGTPFINPEYMEMMSSVGFVDIWRTRHPEAREYTWYSAPGQNGFRLDHAFASKNLNDFIFGCHYQHAPRTENASDHSAMVVDLGI